MRATNIRKKLLLFAATALAVSATAGAQVIVCESFSYPDGSLVPNGGWANHSGTLGDLLVSGGQVVVQHGIPSEDANIAFAAVAGNIYYGIDFSVDDLGVPISGTDNEYFAHFREGFNFAGRLDIVPPTGAGDFSVGISSDGSTADAIWPTDLTYGTTYRAVVRYDQDANIAELWIDAAVSTDPSILGADQPDPGDSVVSFALRQSDSDLNETIRVDNLLVGQTFADVVSGATATVRNAGTNVLSFSSSLPVIGTSWTSIVDATLTGHTSAVVFGYKNPANIPLTGGVVLVDPGSSFVLSLSGSGGVVTLAKGVPNNTALCGFTFSAQAFHFGGAPGIGFGNALDLKAGAF